jgi:hypothetical protein
MPELVVSKQFRASRPQQVAGRVVAVLTTADLGRKGFVTAAVDSLALDLEGIEGNRHRGWTRKADARVPYLPRGQKIRNERQVTLVSVEDLAEVAKLLDLPTLDPAWLGANIVVAGVPHFSWLPRGTRLFSSGGAVLIVTDQNVPCRQAGAAVAARCPGRDDITFGFVKHAVGLRGLLATVEHPGTIAGGTDLLARLPAQWIYDVKVPAAPKSRTRTSVKVPTPGR